jgi:hypothetical protein
MNQQYITKNSQLGVLSTRTLVRERDTFWNPLMESVLKVGTKLTCLGFIYLDGEVVIIEPATEDGF